MIVLFSTEGGFALPGLAGRTAVVTGGAQGIGLAVSRLLADQGATVYALDVRLPPEETRDPALRYLQCDVGDPESVDRAFEAVENRSPAARILVNNAGILRRAPVAELDLADWELQLRVNLTGALLCSRRALPAMCEAAGGRVVLIGSSAGKTGGGPGMAAYAASKAGVLSLAKSLAKEYAPYGITVNGLAPAAIETEMVRDLGAFPVPIGRLGHPEEVGAAVAFLCSDAAAFITGEVMDLNGGLVID